MTTLKEQIEAAAFWGGEVCPQCLGIEEEGQETCPDCDVPTVEATFVVRLIERIEAEEVF